MEKKPNILLFVADQMRSDSLGHMGNPASVTPNLDGLLQEGVSFRNAYCQNPVCVPSRCSFLTGLYPHTTGHRTMHFLQNPDEPNILKVMKQAGYEVIWVGRNDVIPGDRTKEEYCDEYYNGVVMEDTKGWSSNAFGHKGGGAAPRVKPEEDDNYYSFYTGRLDGEEAKESFDWKCMRSALNYLDRRSREADPKPFFLYVTLTFPHPPYGCEEPWYSKIDRKKLPPRRPGIGTLKNKPSMLYGINSKQNLNGWSEERFDELRATYLAMVSRFDHQYGLISEKLKETGVYEDTNVIVFSDHGDYTGDYTITEKVQNCFENPICNVPLLIKPSRGYESRPRISEALAELVDLPETIADMAGIKLPYKQFGVSLMEAVKGSESHKDAVFCEGGRLHGEEHCMEKGHGPLSPYWPRLDTQCSEGPEHTKAVMIRMGTLKYIRRLYETDELYDLEKDPMELNNIINDMGYQDVIIKLKERLLTFFLETGDYVPNRRDIR
ncbi:MAG: sulfatase-like hydrolase/transferase [Hungatella sp.]|nr:sulfatase-like hydrolase/transferase [Hungatella sp.]